VANGGSAVRPSHRGGGAGFVDENQVIRVHRRHLLAKRTPLLLHPGRIPLRGMMDFLLARDPISPQCAPNCHDAAFNAACYAQSVPQLREGRIRLLTHQIEKASTRLLEDGLQHSGRGVVPGMILRNFIHDLEVRDSGTGEVAQGWVLGLEPGLIQWRRPNVAEVVAADLQHRPGGSP